MSSLSSLTSSNIDQPQQDAESEEGGRRTTIPNLASEGGTTTAGGDPSSACATGPAPSWCTTDHGIDKLDYIKGFSANIIAKSFGFLPGTPAFWTVSSAATQVVRAALLAVAMLVRFVTLSMMAMMGGHRRADFPLAEH